MNRRLFFGIFDQEQNLIAATKAARAHGLHIVDVFTPYAVHGLDEALGWRSSRLSRVCFGCGLLGVLVAFAFQFWTMAIDWPINVGGRPWNSWPAFVPVAFELMVLFGGLGVVFAFFAVARLFPGKQAALPLAGVTTDRFVLVLDEGDAAFDPWEVHQLLQDYHVISSEEREEVAPTAKSRPVTRRNLKRLNVALGVVLAGVVLVNWSMSTNPAKPNMDFIPQMVHSVPYDSFAANSNFADGRTLQKLPEGTIARGHPPLPYKGTKEDAIRAGEELRSPIKADDKEARPRGAQVYATYCQVCHGPEGRGDGTATQRNVPSKTLVGEDAVKLKDGQMFHIVTFGQNNNQMASYAAQVAPLDRWRVILHIRELQKRAAEKVKK